MPLIRDKDVIYFYNEDDVKSRETWFGELYNIVVLDIRALKESLDYLDKESVKTITISPDPNNSENEGFSKPLIVFLANNRSEDSIPDIKHILQDAIDKKLKILEAVVEMIEKLKFLKSDIIYMEKPVVFVVDAIWWPIFEWRYRDLKFAEREKERTKGLTVYDPYYSLVQGCFMGSATAAVGGFNL